MQKRPVFLPLPLLGLDIRTEKGVFLSFFGVNLAVFTFLFSAWECGFGQFWQKKLALVDIGPCGIRTRDLWRDGDKCYRFD